MSNLAPLSMCLVLLPCFTLSSVASSQSPVTWVKDINTNPAPSLTSSNPSPSRTVTSQNSQRWAIMGGWFYFMAKTDTNGYELHKSNGRSAVLVKDIYPGRGSSSPGYMTVVGSKIYFRATSSTLGSELWVSDGTAAGTRMVKDIRVGPLGSYPTNLARVGSKITFVANDGAKGSELWVSDGTNAGTKMLKDIRSGSLSSSIRYNTSTASGHLAFFQANDGTNGYELWVTDATAAGTKLVRNIRPGSPSSFAAGFQTLGAKKVVFQADDGTNGTELWVSDGSSAGTRLVKDIYPGRFGGASFYSAISLGTTSGKVLFLGRTSTTGSEPWITDGTASGTFLLKNVNPGSGSSWMTSGDADGGKAYWGCTGGPRGYEIWVTDGTVLGTKRFSKANMSRRRPFYIAATGGKVFFQGVNVTANTGSEICMTDGLTTTTVKDIRAGTLSGNAGYCSKIGVGTVAFSADDGSNGRELWISKGTTATTTMLDINPIPVPAPTKDDSVSYIEPLFGKLIFSATDGTDTTKGQKGQELYISDGTAAGTRLLKDINLGSSKGRAFGSSPRYMCRLGNYVYFYASGGEGYELWRTDGTTAGTKLFKDIRSGLSSSYPSYMTRIKDKIYFQANDGSSGSELWVTDGTVAGTKLVKDIYPGSFSSSPRGFARLGSTRRVVFSANSPGKGYELWITDGTSAGTKLVRDISFSFISSFPSYLKSYKGKVFFTVGSLTVGTSLWETDGTPWGTKQVGKIGPARHIEVQNGMLYFSAWASKTGVEMYQSDGTSAGTGLFRDINPGSSSTTPSHMTAVGSRRIYFRGNFSVVGRDEELIMIDVTNKSLSSRMWNVNPTRSSTPTNYASGANRFAVASGSVYMAANKSPIDRADYQLLKVKSDATAQPIGEARGSSRVEATDPRIGKSMTVKGTTAVANPLSVLCLGIENAKPSGLGSLVPGAFAYFDLSKFFLIVAGQTGKTWTSVLPIPNDVTLIGDRSVLQVFSLDVRGFPANTEATNGVHLTFGR